MQPYLTQISLIITRTRSTSWKTLKHFEIRQAIHSVKRMAYDDRADWKVSSGGLSEALQDKCGLVSLNFVLISCLRSRIITMYSRRIYTSVCETLSANRWVMLNSQVLSNVDALNFPKMFEPVTYKNDHQESSWSKMLAIHVLMTYICGDFRTFCTCVLP